MELIGMSDKVIKTSENPLLQHTAGGQVIKEYFNIVDYANFLKLKLELWMFIPCDKDNDILEEPTEIYLRRKYGNFWNDYQIEEEKQYQEALDRVIFEGFEFELSDFMDGFCGYLYLNKKHVMDVFVRDNNLIFEIDEDVEVKTIEDLTTLGLTIKESAVKKYNLT